MTDQNQPTYTLRQHVFYFLKLGSNGFGGLVLCLVICIRIWLKIANRFWMKNIKKIWLWHNEHRELWQHNWEFNKALFITAF